MFSVKGTYPAVGLFCLAHIISIIMCLVFIMLTVFLTRKMSKSNYFKMLKIFAIVLTFLESVKIIFTWYEGCFKLLDFWLPLYFCSLFIYAMLMSGFGKGKVEKIGKKVNKVDN